MAEKQMNAVLRLRRDKALKYNLLRSFIPLDGEVCIVDTAREGIKIKIGDGITQWENLPYSELGVLQLGYQSGGIFYADQEHTEALDMLSSLYIDLDTNRVWYKTSSGLKEIKVPLPNATRDIPGILKLYDTWDGLNEDGAVTQAALKQKFDSMKVKLTSSREMFDLSGLGIEVID